MFYLLCHIHYLPTVFLLPLYSTVPPEVSAQILVALWAILPRDAHPLSRGSIFSENWRHTFIFSLHSIARQTGRDWPSLLRDTLWLRFELFSFLQLNYHLIVILQAFHFNGGIIWGTLNIAKKQNSLIL